MQKRRSHCYATRASAQKLHIFCVAFVAGFCFIHYSAGACNRVSKHRVANQRRAAFLRKKSQTSVALVRRAVFATRVRHKAADSVPGSLRETFTPALSSPLMRPSVRDPAAVPGRRGSPCEVASSERDWRRRVRTPPAAESEARPGCEEEEEEEVGRERSQEEKKGEERGGKDRREVRLLQLGCAHAYRHR